ncbi:MAG TPA: fumarate hydratase [Candidatus Excrementavichristensenella intestinipullorum]|nr:fumarate hydratase [Candidatus Excrementavichristensenella intestinipullorum]
MREIQASQITAQLKALILQASYNIGPDVEAAVAAYKEKEPSPSGRAVLEQLLQNYAIAREEQVAICQDTGMCVIFLDVGQEVHIAGGSLQDALAEGVRQAYGEGYLRKSVVRDPLYDRTNTRDNTPPVVHTRIVPGDKIDMLVTPKGFGSENMSRTKMLVPADGEQGVIDFVVNTVIEAGPNPCPPVIVGVGIGGTLEVAALMAKRMTARALDEPNPDPRYAQLEQVILEKINRSGVGPAGIGGRTTALKVNIATYPTHIAGMPVAVNVCCHAARHAHAVL